jgi:S1-C subfamily serine protease
VNNLKGSTLFKQYILAIGLLISTAIPSFAWDIDKMNEQIEATNVIVSEICSGTIIDKDRRLVLTAHHCITDNLKEVEKQEVDSKTGEIRTIKVMKKTPMFIETWGRKDGEVVTKEVHTTTIVGYNEKFDIAILQVDDLLYQPKMEAPLAPETYEYKRGKDVFAVGNPGIVFDNTVTKGIISAPLRSLEMGGDFTIPFFQHSASIIGGSSGGAIYNDSGELIGTVSAGVRGADIGLAVPISKTRELLKQIGY